MDTAITATAATEDLDRIISGAMLRLRTRLPFFGALALFARIQFREDVPTAATDGRDIFWNPGYLRSLKPAEVDGVLLHEVLHAALLHVVRRGERNALMWNIAADIVVNGMVMAEAKRGGAFALPSGGVRDEKLENLAVEEVYELIQNDQKMRALAEAWRDLLEWSGGRYTRAEMEAHWRGAHAQAQTLMRASGRGDMAMQWRREFAALEPAQLDWRSHLWRFLVRTPTDFSGFDRRFIGRGLYLEALEGESVQVFVGIDTSGSIGQKELSSFVSEVQGILRAYPHVCCDLFYVDAAAYGPYRLHADTDANTFPKPVGGGGTDFCPFFKAVEKEREEGASSFGALGAPEPICVYLTDGYGRFPDPAPPLHTLWVVTPGGLDLKQFPFGEAVRLVQ